MITPDAPPQPAPPPNLGAPGTGPPVAVKRTSEIEEPTNAYFIHPISRALVTVFASWGVSPNVVSLLGLLFGIGAALAYSQYAAWTYVLIGFVMMIAWHVMDGADGQLARLTGKTSEIGRALDGLVDHGTFFLVYISLAIASADVYGNWVWVLAIFAGVSHAVQASTYEAQRYAYDYWVQRKASARIPTPAEFKIELAGMTGGAWVLGQLNLLYLTVQARTGVGALQQRLEAVQAEAGGAERVAAAYRATHLAGVRRWNLLCSNYRTIAIAVACLVYSPVAFFVFEGVVLNVVFAALLLMQRKQDAELLRALASSDRSVT